MPKEIKTQSNEDMNILILDIENKTALELRAILVEKITNAKVFTYNNKEQLFKDIADTESQQKKCCRKYLIWF